MNVSTKCNCCCHEEVCRFKEEYTAAVLAVKSTSWATPDKAIVQLTDSPVVSVSIRCNAFRGNTPITKKEA